MSDTAQIVDMFEPSNKVAEPSYADVEWLQLTDTSGGNYTTGQLEYNLEMYKNRLLVLADSYLMIPLKVSLATNKPAAVKCSVLSFLQGATCQVAGTSLWNESKGSLPIMANMKLLCDSDLDYITCNGLMYTGHGKYINPNIFSTIGGTDQNLLGAPSADASSSEPSIDALRNPPLRDRITLMEVRAQNSGTYDKTLFVYIPLKYVHGYFRAMDFPLSNVAHTLQFQIAGISGTQGASYFPVVCPSKGTCATTGANDGTGAPTLAQSAAITAAAAPSISILSSWIWVAMDVHRRKKSLRLFERSIPVHSNHTIRSPVAIMRCTSAISSSTAETLVRISLMKNIHTMSLCLGSTSSN